MDLHKTILFYSKYSQSSNNLLKLIDTCGVKIQEIIGYRLISVDSKSVRKQLLNNRDITINHVPCLIKMFNNGTVEQYNYKELYELIEYTIKLHKEELLKQQPLPVVNTPVKEYTPVVTQDETSSESEIEEIVVKPKKKQKKKPKKEVKEKSVSFKKNTTDIDINGETESEVEDTVEPFDTRTEKLTANKQKSNDLMSVAMELQKQRESLDDTTSNNQKIKTRMGPV
jgi:hypothetical protein